MTLSPAERFALAKAKAKTPLVEEFALGLSHDLDPFQREACSVLERDRSVLVAAPTGAGKTIIAEFAIFKAMREPRAKVFYTTPMKALSNQKFQELCDEYGSSEVGLLTGSVTYDPPPIDPPADVNILICCSTPRAEVAIDL